MKRELTKKQISLLFIGFIFLCAIAIILAFINSISHIDKRELYIGYAPFTSVVKIDDQIYRNNTNSWIALGEHHITVSLNEFETYENVINITNNTDAIYGFLESNTNQGEKIKNEHLADYQKVESYYSSAADLQGKEEKSIHPILNLLPYKNSLYSLGYITKDNQPILTVSTSEPYLDQAINKLKSLSDTIENYELLIKSPSNPFENISKNPSNAQDPLDFIIETYKNQNQVFDVYSGKIEGDYYYTKITTGSTSTYNLITYKVILKKTESSYELLSNYPSPLVSIYNTKNVPEHILKKANDL